MEELIFVVYKYIYLDRIYYYIGYIGDFLKIYYILLRQLFFDIVTKLIQRQLKFVVK